jgi:secretion system chaperone SscA
MSSSVLRKADASFFGWIDQIAHGKNPYGEISEEKIEEVYALAYFLYKQKHFFDAASLFRQLTISGPSVSKYWKGLGACLQLEKEYEEALHCYAAAQLLNDKNKDPTLYVHAADCYFALGDKKNGRLALRSAARYAEKQDDHRLLHHLKLMTEIWSKE